MKTMTIRGYGDRLSRALHEESEKRGMSINKLVLETLETTFLGDKRKQAYDDLDHLAGTWSAEDADVFNRAVADFGVVDPGDWK